MSKNYDLVNHNDFRDLIMYCEVMNYHICRIIEWKNGIALIELSHNMFCVYNGHNGKGYYFNKDFVPYNWIISQFERCSDLYKCSKDVANDIKVKSMLQLEKVKREMRRLDY